MFKSGDKIRRIIDDNNSNFFKVKMDVGDIFTFDRYDEKEDYLYTKEYPNHRCILDRFELVQEKISPPTKFADHAYKNNPFVNEPKESGTKNDQGKPRVSLIPRAALLGMARALSYGEKKYGTHNFRNGLSYSRLADACMRHLSSWMEGETLDPESGLSHMDHAIASLAMLKFMEEHRQDMDDRWLDPQFNPEEPELSDEAKQEVAEQIQKRGR